MAGRGRYTRRWLVEFSLPNIANPTAKAMINNNASFNKNFCETFSDENEPFVKFLVVVFEFLSELHDPEKYIEISKKIQEEKEKYATWLTRIVSSILRFPTGNKEELYSYHKDFCALYKQYKSEEQYKEDIEQLNEHINKNSEKIKNHPYKFIIWIDSNYDPTIEKFLDPEILNELKVWLQERSLTENALGSCSWARLMNSDLELCELILEITERQLAKRQKQLKVDNMIVWYDWHKEKRQESEIVKRLKRIFKEILANYSALIGPKHRQLEILYWSAMSAGIVEEKYMAELYKIIHDNPDFPSMPWYAERAESARITLINMLKSGNQGAARLAAITLSQILQSRFFSHRRKTIKKALSWVGDKYWEFAKDKEDTWRPRYIEGMAQCQLKWAEKSQEWLKAIKETNTEELQSAWCRVVVEGHYHNVEDRNALFDLLLHILDSGDTFAKVIRSASLRRLYGIVSEVETVEFDERLLNLPLSRRTSFS